jgi:hypothetical protein
MRNISITSFLVTLIFKVTLAQTGNVGIGTSTPDVSAKLEINTTSDGNNSKKGLLISQIALGSTSDGAPFSSLSPAGPATGLLVYNTNASISGIGANGVGFYYNSGTKASPVWVRLLNNINAWLTIGNTGNTTPAVPATYGTTTIGSSENWLGNIDGKDLVFGTNNLERMRLKHSGSIAIGTANNTTGTIPWDTTFNISINPYKTAQRGGIYIQYPGSGTIGTTSYAFDVDVATNSNQYIRGFRFRSGTTATTNVFYGTGSELTSTNIVSGYTGYRNGSGLSYGIYGVNGTNSSYVTNANTWALWSQGRAVISSETAPTSPLGVDLEIRNTSTGLRYPPATLSMRNTVSLGTIGDTLGRIYFGDNYQTAAQSEIRVIRDAAAGSVSDIPTAMSFFTIPDAGNTLTERVRIANTGNVIIGSGEASSTTAGNTLRGPNRTGTNVAGADLSIAAGNGTGTGGSGNLLFFTSPTAASSSTANTLTERVRINNAGNVGIANNNPDDKLDVTGNAQVSGYLRVGNPTAPNIPAGYDIIYQDDFEGDIFWTVDGAQNCGSGTWDYFLLTSGDLFTTSIGWDTWGSRSRVRFQSPSIWIPSYYSSFYITDNSRSIGSFDEDGYDGVFLLWKDEGATGSGTTWTKITSFTDGGYSGQTADGCNTTCSGTNNQSCWDFNDKGTDYGLIYDETTNISSTGRYIRVGFEGFEDASGDDETFHIYDCVVYGNRSAFSSTFNTGSIYAEGPIFASVQYRLGDMAEYFEVDRITEPGDLIAISKNGSDKYTKATIENPDLVLGIHSANPSITLNSPKNGVPVALAGRVPVKVNNENGAIKIGDYLTISSVPGIATKATKSSYVIGRALENFNSKEGKILCMVQTGWANVNSRPTITSGGSFKFTKGTDIIKVIDQSIQPDSRVFVSFREFAGSEFKVGKIGNGFFELQLKQMATSNIPFDYFIDNAVIPTKNDGPKGQITITDNIPQVVYNTDAVSNNSTVKENGKTDGVIDSPNKLSQEIEAKFPSKHIAVINAKVDDGTKTPPLPPDPNQVWLWTPDKGFFTMADVKNSKSPYKEIELQKLRSLTK